MKRVWVALLAALAFAAASASPAKYQPSSQEVLVALAHHSGVPEETLRGLLANCDASQSAMNMCAYRDAISADLVLQHAVISKVEQLPSCKARLEAKIARWKVERDRGCKRNSDKAYGGASLEPMAMSLCMAHEAEQMTKQVERQRACKR